MVAATHLFAALQVADVERARAWYERLLDRPPDLIPNDDEACWTLTDTAWIYLIRDPERAGTSLATVLVEDLPALAAELRARGLAVDPLQTIADGVLVTVLTDPDGNRLQLGQPPAA